MTTKASKIFNHENLPLPALKTKFLKNYENDQNIQNNFSASKSTIKQALKKYSLDQLCVCFDGGKDGQIVLEILRQELESRGVSEASGDQSKVIVLNIISQNPIPKCVNLVKNFTTKNQKHFKLLEIHNQPNMISALKSFKSSNPSIKSIFMGTRRTDNSFSKNLKTFSQTSSGWPEFELINPVLDWGQVDVWVFLLKNEIEYCDLYDEGYTSLGELGKTGKNELLKIETGNYLPAFCLLSGEDERSSR